MATPMATPTGPLNKEQVRLIGLVSLTSDQVILKFINYCLLFAVRAYQTLDELHEALLNGEVDGILLDAYVVGSRKDLFKNPNLLVNKIKDYRSAYGIVWAGKSSRMKVCLDWYMKSRKSKMFRHIAGNLEMVKKVKKISLALY
jgi:hypothetical protein